MRRQIVITGGLGFFEVQPGQRCLDLDRFVGFAAVAPDHYLDALDPVIVACLIVDPQRCPGRCRRRFCEGDLGRVVGNDFDWPASERRARLGHLELLAARKCRSGAEVLLVDSVEIAALTVDRQTRYRVPAMHLRQQRAAGRDADRLRRSRPQKLRRQSGVLGWGDPDVEARGQCGRSSGQGGDSARTSRSRQSTPASIAAISSSIASTRPQPQGVASGQPGGRQADPQPARRRLHAPPMRLPQLRRLRIERRARAVGERLQRPMLKPARLLRCGGGRRCDRAGRTGGLSTARATTNSSAEAKQQGSVEQTGQKRQEIEQGQRQGRRRSTASAGQQAGQTRSHNSAARARRSRAKNGASGSDERSVMRHLVFAPAPGSASESQDRNGVERQHIIIARSRPDDVKTSAGDQHLGHQRPAYCRSSSSPRHKPRRS